MAYSMGIVCMNTKEEIIDFKPTKEYFIGVDSDGTAFDSMNIKHIKSMYPAAVEVWDFGTQCAEFEKIWKRINLYSKTRGINRFLGLLAAFEDLGANSPVKDISAFREYIKNNSTYSNATLQSWMLDNYSLLLDDVMRWSKKSDDYFEEYTKGLLPFKNVKPCLEILAQKADIMVVSSASGKGLDKDWSFSGLTEYTSLIAGQEIGSKDVQLQIGAAGKYSPLKTLMIGDAPGDLDAANSIGALFFPIMPGNEDESWLLLKEEALDCFFEGSYKGKYEDLLIEEFINLLG